MELTLRPPVRSDWKRLKRLYLSAFPAEERAPFFLLRLRAAQGRGTLLVVSDSGRNAGFAYLLCLRDMAYLFYLAIEDADRGKGYGSAVLRLLRERYRDQRLFLALEQQDPSAPNRDERAKRRAFYRRGGFEELPFRIKEGNVIYDAMGVGGPVTPEEYDALITAWGGKLLRRFVDLRVLPL